MSYYYITMAQNYLSVLESGEFSDVTIRVGKEDNIKEFAVHSFVLRTRSPYFRNALSKYNIIGEKQILEQNNIDPDAFEIILKYFYGGSLKLDSVEFKTLLDTLVAVNEFNIIELIDELQYYFISNMDQQLRQNFVTIYQKFSKYENCKILERFCLNIIQKSPELVFKSKDFNELSEDNLFLILQNELQLEEIEIWNAVIKWGIKQTASIITSDVSLWTRENFRDLGNTLKQIIPLIKFIKIPSKDFYDTVKTYKKVLGKNLYDEILQYHLTQIIPQGSILNQPKRINSLVMDNLKHLLLISSWIDNKHYSYYQPYKFNLLLRGSRDGFHPNVFHRLCDNKGPTVTIVREPYTNNILGGYNPLSWKSCDNIWNADYTGKTKGAFIFSINNLDIKNSILSRPKNEECIINYANSGPNFQVAFTFIYSTRCECTCLRSSNVFKNPIRQTEVSFCVKEYEVFQVLKLNL